MQHIDNELGISYNFEYNGQKYFYRKNLQGDIIGIYDSCWNLLGLYEYDAWGNLLSQVGSEILNINPFRYRGYYCDTESGIYYLNSRYYDPVIGRFISPDSINYLEPGTHNGLNLYAYCGNNPVMHVDPYGHEWWDWALGALLVVALTAAVAATAGAAAAAIGASIGVGSALVNATVVGATIGGLAAGGMELISQGLISNWHSVNFGSLAIETFTGSLSGAAAGMMGSTTSVGVRLAMRGTQVAIAGLRAALHGINNGNSFGATMASVGIAIATGIALQGAMIGYDVFSGNCTTAVLESYALDGALFILKDKLLIAGTAILKNIFVNRQDWYGVIFG